MYKEYAKNIQKIRREHEKGSRQKKLSQGALARLLDVDKGYISNIESGNKRILPLRQFKG